MRQRPIRLAAFAVLALALPLAACGSDDDSSSDTTADTAAGSTPAADTAAPGTDATGDTTAGGDVTDGPTVTIGAQDFGESAILAEIYGQALESAGYPVSQQALGGFRDIVFTSFDSGDINFTPEYAASALEFLNDFAGEASADVDATVELLQAQLEPLGLLAFTPSPAVDSNSFVVTAETAEEFGLENISDLTDDLTLGAPSDCTENAYCIPGLQSVYDLDLSANFVPLEAGQITVAALEGGEIDVANLFSTNGIIADKGWVVLNDDKGLFDADNVVPVVTQELADAYGEALRTLIDEISAALTTEELTELNRLVDIELEDANVVALDWLKSEGFVS